MRAILEKMKSENGAASIIEMTLIFPLVIMILMFLIYLGAYIYDNVTIYNNSQMIAVAVSREVSVPGYEKFYENGGITTKADFNWNDGYSPTPEIINSIMGVHKPYRYWTQKMIDDVTVTSMEKALKNIVSTRSFLVSADVTCDIKVKNHYLSQTVEVNVKRKINTPKFFDYIGFKSSWDIDITATAVVSDSSEFVRNTDMVFDLANYLLEEIKIGGKSVNEQIANFKQKFKDTKAKLGW